MSQASIQSQLRDVLPRAKRALGSRVGAACLAALALCVSDRAARAGDDVAPRPQAALSFPLLKLGLVPVDRAVDLPAGAAVLDVEVQADGSRALVVLAEGKGTRLYTWSFAGALVPVSGLPKGEVREIGISPFDAAVYLLLADGGRTRVERGMLQGDAWRPGGLVLQSERALRGLVVPFVAYNEVERIFMGRALQGGAWQIVSVTGAGGRAYEVTSPSGEPGPFTDKALLVETEDSLPPAVVKLPSAWPVSVHPMTGALTWTDGARSGLLRYGELNWDEESVPLPKGSLGAHPNGWYQMSWSGGEAGLGFLGPEGEPVGRIAVDRGFTRPPAIAANGRAFVGVVPGRLVTGTVGLPFAPVRFLARAQVDVEPAAELAKYGITVSRSQANQLYGPYDEIAYSGRDTPVFASIDGMLEVLHAGFEAVFVRIERDLSRPRLAAFLVALQETADRQRVPRVSRVAEVTAQLLKGDYSSAEGKLVRAEVSAKSELHGTDINFADFHPRGPYATDPQLQDYFRAFKYINALSLSAAERKKLSRQPALVGPWKAWVETQQPFLSGSRYQGLFDGGASLPTYVRPPCLPLTTQANPFRVFPLSWGWDSEILDRGVAHDRSPPQCGVPQRIFPSGLDLLASLGSAEARAILGEGYVPPFVAKGEDFPTEGAPARGAAFPTLARVQDDVGRLAIPGLADPRLPTQWLGVVGALGAVGVAPEQVDPHRWQRRLMESALASWTSFRHTVVLVSEASGAEAGEGGDAAFERLSFEPSTHVVDPLPRAWDKVADLLALLAKEAERSPTEDRLAEVLREASTSSRRLGRAAERQIAGEPLSREDYAFIAWYAGVIEHPYRVLKSAAAASDELVEPEPMAKIVDIHTWSTPTYGDWVWHAAVGQPLRTTVLLGDRGLLLPGAGATYSYYEVVSSQPRDDAWWREQVETAERPAWTVPAR